MAALAAEEMDLDWDSVNVMHGPPAQAYYNGALLGLALPYHHYTDSEFMTGLRETVGEVGKLLNLQVTGGSTSTRDAYSKMREAGATARETLKLAAAKRLGVNVVTLKTENGHVFTAGGEKISYIDLAAEAALIDPPSVDLRPKGEWKMLGKSLPRTDMVGKVTGTATYATDVPMDGMKFATVRMNPRRSGMLSYEETEASAMDGVDRVLDLGDGIAVVASNTWLAFQAAEMVKIEWETAAYPETTEALMDAITASLDSEPDSITRDDGDVDAAVEGTEITAQYQVPWLAHSTMEPMTTTALYTGDVLTIWAGNQAPIGIQDKCAKTVGLTPDQVTVNTTFMGGAFGRRSESDAAVQAAKIAKEFPGTPIRMTWSREEDMRHDFYRPAAAASFRGVVKDGAAVLLHGKIAGPSVTHQSSMRLAGQIPPGPDRGHVEGAADQPYSIPNFRLSGHLTNIDVPIGFWRSVGNSFNGFFFDTFIDEMAIAAGTDPLQFRLAMAAKEHAASAKVLETVAEMANWTGQTPDGVGRGVGFTYSFGTPVAEIVEVVDEDGDIRINKCWIACDVGTALDPSIIEAQMISGAIYGMSAAAQGEITFTDGMVDQWNFPDYDALRMHNTPSFEVQILESGHGIGGVGEPGTPPSMPALGNALYDLTGTRATELPLIKTFNLLL
jgi:isoquinoline 1-oxidoreductase beta subunit